MGGVGSGGGGPHVWQSQQSHSIHLVLGTRNGKMRMGSWKIGNGIMEDWEWDRGRLGMGM